MPRGCGRGAGAQPLPGAGGVSGRACLLSESLWICGKASCVPGPQHLPLEAHFRIRSTPSRSLYKYTQVLPRKEQHIGACQNLSPDVSLVASGTHEGIGHRADIFKYAWVF